MIAALDTMVFIDGISQKGDGATRNSILATYLFQELEEEGFEVHCSWITISEILVKIPPAKHHRFIATFQERFKCDSFGPQAASLAAELFADRAAILGQDVQKGRNLIKNDVLILAAAKAGGAARFYSNDDDMHKLGKHIKLPVLLVPTGSVNLFRDSEIKQKLKAIEAADPKMKRIPAK